MTTSCDGRMQHSTSSLCDDNLFCYYLFSDFLLYTIDMSDLSVVVCNRQVCPI